MVFVVVVDVANTVVVAVPCAAVVAVPCEVAVFATDFTIVAVVALSQIFLRVPQNKYYLKLLVVIQEKQKQPLYFTVEVKFHYPVSVHLILESLVLCVSYFSLEVYPL